LKGILRFGIGTHLFMPGSAPFAKKGWSVYRQLESAKSGAIQYGMEPPQTLQKVINNKSNQSTMIIFWEQLLLSVINFWMEWRKLILSQKQWDLFHNDKLF
jgi:hypothetical protein